MVFIIDGEKWTLVLTPGERKVFKGEPEGKPNLTLTISDENFVKLVMGKMGPQQVCPSNALVGTSSAVLHCTAQHIFACQRRLLLLRPMTSACLHDIKLQAEHHAALSSQLYQR